MLNLQVLKDNPVPVATAVLLSGTMISLPQGVTPVVPAGAAPPVPQNTVIVYTPFEQDLALEASLQHRVAAELREKQAKLRELERLKETQAQKVRWRTVSTKSLNRGADTKAVTSKSLKGLVNYALSFKGVPYLYGGTDPKQGLDCSAFTQLVFRKFGIELPRSSITQFRVGVGIPRASLRTGDLVFFSTNGAGASHVGLYLQDGNFISATTRGVRITNLKESYWNKYYRGARRVLNT